MKAPGHFGWVSAAFFTVLGGLANASPDHIVTTKERLLGSNDKAYAVLRTELDNCGSYYESKAKVHLIERFADGSAPEKSTLLSETQRVIDATH
ncbi:MAG TPA: hypothetical protein VGE67_17470, partial [Haloferula sp.]